MGERWTCICNMQFKIIISISWWLLVSVCPLPPHFTIIAIWNWCDVLRFNKTMNFLFISYKHIHKEQWLRVKWWWSNRSVCRYLILFRIYLMQCFVIFDGYLIILDRSVTKIIQINCIYHLRPFSNKHD